MVVESQLKPYLWINGEYLDVLSLPKWHQKYNNDTNNNNDNNHYFDYVLNFILHGFRFIGTSQKSYRIYLNWTLYLKLC